MNRFSGSALLVIGLAGALIAGVFFDLFTVIPLDKVGPDQVGQTFLGLIFFALVIERATEIYVSGRIEPERHLLAEKSAQQRALLRAAEARLSRARADPNSSAADLQKLEAERDAAAKDYTRAVEAEAPKKLELKAKTQTQTSNLAMGLGIVIALVGVRALGPLGGDDLFKPCIDAMSQALGILGDAKPEDLAAAVKALGANQPPLETLISQADNLCSDRRWQRGLFTGVDVLVTGALLAGSADGLHQIVNRFTRLAQRDDTQGGG